jgi:outer membrane protein TolC
VSRGTAVPAAVLAVVLAAGRGLAQPPAAPARVDAPQPPAETGMRLTLAEAVERAQAHSARLAQLRALETASAEGLRGARAARLPRAELRASYTRSSDVPELTLVTPGGEVRTIFPNIPNSYRSRLGVSLPLYAGGQIAGGIEAAREAGGAAAQDLEAARRDLVLETTDAYWSLVTALESERVLREAVAAFEAHLRDARNRLEVGMAARSELLAVQVEKERALLSRLRAAHSAEIVQANLGRLLGLDAGARVLPVEPVLAPEASPPAGEPAALVERALGARPEVAALRARIAAADANARVARGALLPQLSLSGGYEYERPNTRILPLSDRWQDTWSVGVSVAWNAFDGGRAGAAAAQARAQAAAARSQLEELTRQLRLEVTSRALEVETARAGLVVAERALEAAQASLEVSRDRYREGLIPSSELLDAETALMRAGLERTSAASEARVALARLDRAAAR